MGQNYLDAEGFRAYMKRDNDFFKALIGKLGIKG
jgi:N-acetylmuramoyl-L-alanine amidase